MTDAFGRPYDLDQSGRGFHKARSYLGPSLGWVETQILPERRFNAGGGPPHQINPGDSVILTEIGLPITFLLPDVKAWVAQTATQPATGFTRGLTFKDYGGNARDVHVTIVPFDDQTIDGLNQSIILSQDFETIVLYPIVDGTGWYAAIQTFDTGTGGVTAINPTSPIIGNVTGDVMNIGILLDAANFAVNPLGQLSLKPVDPGFVIGNPTISTNPSIPTSLSSIMDIAMGSIQGQIVYRNNAGWVALNPGTNGQVLSTGGPGSNPFWVTAGTGNVITSGSATNGQVAMFTDGFHIQGVAVASAPWVLRAGDTMTGDLTITANNPALRLNSTGGSPDFIVMGHDGLARWSIQTVGTESGGNTGSDLSIVRFDDAGGGIDQIMTVSRQTGLVSFGGDVLVADGDLEVRAKAVPPSGARLMLNKTADIFANFIRGALNGTNRWQLHLGNADPETGSNSGSNFMLQRHNDAGVTIDNVLFFSRQTGLGTVIGNPTAPLGIATKQYVDGQIGTFAPVNSPTFTGDPKAPTPATADNDTSIATTAFVKAQGYATLANPVFTGDPQAPTPATADNDTSIATTAFVKAQGYAVGGPFAPVGAQYIVGATDATLTAERVGTSSASITWDFGTAGQALVKRAALTGDVTAPADSNATTLATVNANVGTFQGITVNGKGLVTAAVNQNYFSNIATQKLIASGTYTPTAGMKFAIIEAIGGGGGAGGSAGAISFFLVGGGGGSGGYSRKVVTAAAVGASQAVTIGTGGAGGAGAVNGGVGGNTSVGTLCVAQGGGGGLFASSGQVPTGGTGAGVGGGAVGDVTVQGAAGHTGIFINSTATTIVVSGGAGGPSALGGGGGSVAGTSATINGNTSGANTGGGGSGGSTWSSATNATGGNGGTGLIIITEFI